MKNVPVVSYGDGIDVLFPHKGAHNENVLLAARNTGCNNNTGFNVSMGLQRDCPTSHTCIQYE